MEENKDENLGGGSRRGGGIGDQTGRAESNDFDLAVIASGVELLAIESKVDATCVSSLDDDLFAASDRLLGAGSHKFGAACLAVDGDRDPGLFAGLDDDRKLAWNRGGDGGYALRSFGSERVRSAGGGRGRFARRCRYRRRYRRRSRDRPA